MTGHSLTSVATPFTGSVAPYYNGTLSHASTFSNGSINPVADVIAQYIYTERKQEFVIALSKLLPTAASTAKISPLVRFLNTQLDELGGLEKVKTALYKPQGYFSRLLGKESWMEWSEDRTDLGYVVSNMAGILSTLGNGQFILAWTSSGNVYAKLFKASFTGTPEAIGDEFLVNTNTQGSQAGASVIAIKDGFIITWSSEHGDNSGWGICGQLFELKNGQTPIKVGSQFQVNAETQGNQDYLMAIPITNNSFLVAWESNPSISSSISSQVSAQLFNISTTCPTIDDNPSDDNPSSGYSKGLPGLLGIIPIGFILWWCCRSAKCNNSVGPEEGAGESRISVINRALGSLRENHNIEPGAQWFGSPHAPQAEANRLGEELRELRYGKGCSIL